jgi:hypothetical protein
VKVSGVRIGLGVLGLSVAVLATALVVQRTDDFSGDPGDVAAVKTALPKLVHGDRTAGNVPTEPSKLTSATIHSPESVDQRKRAVRAVWAPGHVAAQLKLWNDYLDEMVEVKELYGFDATDPYDNTRFDVTEWLGVRVTGTKAVVDVRAYDAYHFLADRGWVKGQALHHRFTLWRESRDSDRWFLVDEEHDVDNEFRVMGGQSSQPLHLLD